MPVNYKRVQELTRSLAVDLGTDLGVLNIKYYPNRYNTPVEKAFSEKARTSGQPIGSTAELLSKLVSSWDMVTEDENPDGGDPITRILPVSKEILEDLGGEFINKIGMAIIQDMNPGEAKSAN